MKLIRDRIPCPFTVAVDTREKHPFSFTGICGDGPAKDKTLLVPIENVTLATGDYTVIVPDLSAGLAVERKSLADFIATIVRNRERFQRELDRMSEMISAHVVVEADWRDVLERASEFTQAPAKTIHRSVISWTLTYPTVHWHLCGTRFIAERTCFRILHAFWKRHGADAPDAPDGTTP